MGVPNQLYYGIRHGVAELEKAGEPLADVIGSMLEAIMALF